MLAQPAGDDAIGLGETGLPCTLGIGGRARCDGRETFGIGRLSVYIWNWPFDRITFWGEGEAERDFSDFPGNLLPVFRLSINQSRVGPSFLGSGSYSRQNALPTYLPTYCGFVCGRQPPGSVPHLPTVSYLFPGRSAERSENTHISE